MNSIIKKSIVLELTEEDNELLNNILDILYNEKDELALSRNLI